VIDSWSLVNVKLMLSKIPTFAVFNVCFLRPKCNWSGTSYQVWALHRRGERHTVIIANLAVLSKTVCAKS